MLHSIIKVRNDEAQELYLLRWLKKQDLPFGLTLSLFDIYLFIYLFFGVCSALLLWRRLVTAIIWCFFPLCAPVYDTLASSFSKEDPIRTKFDVP